jgi:hypothetical protein
VKNMTDEGDGLEAHPDLGATGASMREQWRAEQEAAMKDAVESRAHRLTLQDRFREHMHRGDRIAVTVAGRRIAGVPEEIGADLLAVRTLLARVDIHLCPTIPFWYELVEKSPQGGHRGSDSAGGTFQGALLVREQDAHATIGTIFDADGIDGKLVVGTDHVVIVARTGKETTVPIAQVSWVAPTRS